MNASRADASGGLYIANHVKNDTRLGKRISAHISTRYAGADEDEDVADNSSDSSVSMLQHPRPNSFRRARDARKVRWEADNERAQESADEAADSPANGIEKQ